MRTETTGTILHGSLQLDHPIDLPDNSRVRVAVEPEENWRARFNAGLQTLQQLSNDHPIHAGGRRYNRDELHERH